MRLHPCVHRAIRCGVPADLRQYMKPSFSVSTHCVRYAPLDPARRGQSDVL